METYDAVILGDGDFPRSPEALAVLDNARYLCCCDNAGRRMIEAGRMPDAIVGDGDSLPLSFKQQYAGIYHQVDEQDYNDLTKATRFCIRHLTEAAEHAEQMDKGQQSEYAGQALSRQLTIAYLGTTGKREDHTIGNIALMAFYRRQFGIKPVMITDYGTFTVHHQTEQLQTFQRQQVSIFNISCSQLESKGLKWDAYPYRELWQGTLNEAIADTVTIIADGEYIIYRTHCPKV